jgi:hypothetical protein
MGVEAVAGEFDPSGGTISEYAGKAVKKGGGKLVDKGRDVAKSKIDEQTGRGYGRLLD